MTRRPPAAEYRYSKTHHNSIPFSEIESVKIIKSNKIPWRTLRETNPEEPIPPRSYLLHRLSLALCISQTHSARVVYLKNKNKSKISRE